MKPTLSKPSMAGINTLSLMLAFLLIITYIAFAGLLPFNTKGEPREAIVAVSMLNQGNWILPVSLGADIPYKPPMLAWCIALLGWLNGGVVTEFLSRMPSAIAMIVMTVIGFRLFARRTNTILGMAMALIFATSLEVFRAATVCRVDMLLTMFIVTALYSLFRQWECHRHGTWAPSWAGVLLMSGAVLTKGPVGFLLPCMVIWVFRLLKGNRFWQTTVSVGLSGLLSLLLPCLWYLAAYRQGGEEFLYLAMEENFGRFTGKMSYDSHVNPAWYNVVTLLAGLAPYTLLLLLSLFWRPWKRAERSAAGAVRGFKDALSAGLERLRRMDAVDLLSLLAAVLIFIFYCIPKSKRSVYLLPVYPFCCYFIARYLLWLWDNCRGAVKVYAWIITATGVLASLLVLSVMYGLVPPFGKTHTAEAIELMGSYGTHLVPSLFTYLVLVGAIFMGRKLTGRGGSLGVLFPMLLFTMSIFWMLEAAVLPAVMGVKTDRPIACAITNHTDPDETLFAWRPNKYDRYYIINYYMDDRLVTFCPPHHGMAENTGEEMLALSAVPASGKLLIGDKDVEQFNERFGRYVSIAPLFHINRRSTDGRQTLTLYRFTNSVAED